MNLAGSITIGTQQYFLFLNDVKASMTYIVYNKYHKDDVAKFVKGEALDHVVLQNVKAFEYYATPEYAIEGVSRTKVSGKVKAFGNNKIITKVLDTVSFAGTYTFRKDDIALDENSMQDGELCHTFHAEDNNLAYSYTLLNNLYKQLIIKDKTSGISIELSKTSMKAQLKQFDFKEVDKEVKNKVLLSSLKSVTYEMLCETLDMSWFEKDGVRQKNYKSIKTIEEFETQVMTPLVKAIQYAEGTGKQLDVAIDTETTGLNIYDLQDDNPDKDHCVAIPISWEDNAAFVIFTDMQYFSSIDNSYVMKRLQPLIERAKHTTNRAGESIEDTFDVTLYKVNKVEKKLDSMDLFGAQAITEESPVDIADNYELIVDEVVTLHRSSINLIGHNVMFDGRVFYAYDVRPWWDNDTLQMAFDLNPKTVRGSTKLKMLTRKLFGHETPELEDILGKGNEDKYRYLTDELVAIIYGCADADYTRLLFKRLRAIMPDSMYKEYRKQDVPMLNILYPSEFHGMNTVADKVKEEALRSKDNLTILKEFMYDYVGKIVYLDQKRDTIEAKHKAGFYATDEEYQQALERVKDSIPEDTRFEFEIKASDICDVIYGILKYPIYYYTKGDANGNNKKPKTDKNAMKKLIAQKKKKGETGPWDKGWKLTHDVYVKGVTKEIYEETKKKNKKVAKEMLLISAEDFNECKYPLALVLSKYAELNKEYTSYYKPILETNMEGRLFKNYSLARIETRRIMNPGQTIKANLKALIKPYNDDYYLLDFDMSQIEYRIMASLAHHETIIQKMKDPEKDYHIETAALVHRIPAYKVDHDTRKHTKCIGFGKPYGLSDPSLAESLFGAINDDTLFKTRMLLATWEEANKPITDFLEEQRDNALKPVMLSPELRDFMDAWERDTVRDAKGKIISNEYKLDADGKKIPKPIGMSKNRLGFYRTFDLSNMDGKKRSSIRRMAGNYPIQSYAAEIFRIILIRFYQECDKYGLNDKIGDHEGVIWHMLIHDELLCSVHKSIHPFLIYKIVYKACMLAPKGFTNLFVGINIGNTWAECKDDSREAPVYFVKRMIDRYNKGEFQEKWLDDPGAFITPYRKQYVEDRIGEVLRTVQPDFDTGIIDIPLILEKFTNYTVRTYVDDYPLNYEVPELSKEESKDADLKDHYDNEVWTSRLESWIIKVYGEGRQLIDQDGNLHTVVKHEHDVIDTPIVTKVVDDSDDDEVDEYWSFDENDYESGYSSDPVFVADDEDDFTKGMEFDFNNPKAVSIADVIVDKRAYDNVSVLNSQVIIRVKNPLAIKKCKQMLKDNVKSKGKTIMFQTALRTERWENVAEDTDFTEIDKLISSWR